MGCRIIEGLKDGTERRAAVFYCSVRGEAFGPVMADTDEAESFQIFLERRKVIGRDGPTSDPRCFLAARLMELYAEFVREQRIDDDDEGVYTTTAGIVATDDATVGINTA